MTSLADVWQFMPTYPAAHVHEYVLPLAAQRPPFMQGALMHQSNCGVGSDGAGGGGVTSLADVWQFMPTYPAAHMHEYVLPLAAQRPPFMQGALMHQSNCATAAGAAIKIAQATAFVKAIVYFQVGVVGLRAAVSQVCECGCATCAAECRGGGMRTTFACTRNRQRPQSAV